MALFLQVLTVFALAAVLSAAPQGSSTTLRPKGINVLPASVSSQDAPKVEANRPQLQVVHASTPSTQTRNVRDTQKVQEKPAISTLPLAVQHDNVKVPQQAVPTQGTQRVVRASGDQLSSSSSSDSQSTPLNSQPTGVPSNIAHINAQLGSTEVPQSDSSTTSTQRTY